MISLLAKTKIRLRHVIRLYQTAAEGVYGHNERAWREHRSQLRLKLQKELAVEEEKRALQPAFGWWLNAFRGKAHIMADTNPLKDPNESCKEELRPEKYGLQASSQIDLKLFLNLEKQLGLQEMQELLKSMYCGKMAAEFEHVEDEMEKEWLYRRFERLASEAVEADKQREVARAMIESLNWDKFLATKFATVKRYGAEGAEAMMAFYIELFDQAAKHGVEELILGMAHRGRLNVLTTLLKVEPVVLFRKMRGLPEFPKDQQGMGDVLSHLTSSVDVKTSSGKELHVTLLPNPSHLEAVNAVVCGKVRGRSMANNNGDYAMDNKSNEVEGNKSIGIQVHGDAAMVGQGLNSELLQMSRLPHFNVGGSIHLVINNQLGFTTPAERGRSSRNCTDVAKQISAPVLRVNGQDPNALLKATQLALEYQRLFRKDVFIDLMCFRRLGHNELDEPRWTNPAIYGRIDNTRSVAEIYAEQLVQQGLMKEEDVKEITKEHWQRCQANMDGIESYEPARQNLKKHWSQIREARMDAQTQWDTGVHEDTLQYVARMSVQHPQDFSVHSHLQKHHVSSRLDRVAKGASERNVDWATAETMALGSLLLQGFNVRISGQDVGRATFAHRHGMLVDQSTNELHIPLNCMCNETSNCGRIELANSPLSEEAVLGFEYGLSVAHPKLLVVWEAQFGDFFNGAQIILDAFISSGESKWGLHSALVILLPHGMDGAGPEHSSCRIERFLQSSDSKESGADSDAVNWGVANPTTAANYFHLLRRQMVRDFRKPLVVASPKALLRSPLAASTRSELGPKTFFKPVIMPEASKKVETIVLCSGKHAFTLSEAIKERDDMAIVRLEQLVPFPAHQIQELPKLFPNATRYVWSQEEHRNMGCWSFVHPRLRSILGINAEYVGRVESPQPAVGVAVVHREEAETVIRETIK